MDPSCKLCREEMRLDSVIGWTCDRCAAGVLPPVDSWERLANESRQEYRRRLREMRKPRAPEEPVASTGKPSPGSVGLLAALLAVAAAGGRS